MSRRRIIRGATIMALDGRRILRQTDVLIADGIIAAVGGVESQGALITQARGVLLPAFVQAHLHSDEGLLDQRFVPDVDPRICEEVQLGTLKRALDEEAREICAAATYARGMHAGASTFADVVPVDSTAAILASSSLGARLVACVDGARQRDFVEQFEALVTQERPDTVSFGVFGGDIENTPLGTLKNSARLAQNHNVSLFLHAKIPPSTRSLLETLERIDALNPQLVLCHANHGILEAPEVVRRLARAGASVLLTPALDVLMRAKPPPVEQLLDEGVNLALGSDTGMTRGAFDLFREARLFFRLIPSSVLHRASLALEVAASGGARALGLGSGTIQVGKKADLMLCDIEVAEDEDHEALARKILDAGGSDRVRMLWVDGEVTLVDTRFAKTDPPSERTEAKVRHQLTSALQTPLAQGRYYLRRLQQKFLGKIRFERST